MKLNTRNLTIAIALSACIGWALLPQALAFDRYNDGCNDPTCHAAFTDAKSTKGSIFPSDDKHAMHKDSQNMNTDCDLCHTQGDNRNPWLGSSDGTSDNPGLGCSGCHEPVGTRKHHVANNVTWCYQAFCHGSAETGPPENTVPTYYGTPDTKVDDPCNTVAAPETGENWTIGDFIGIDNDGDNDYDLADSDCAIATDSPGEVLPLTVDSHNSSTGVVDLAYTVACASTDNVLVWGALDQVALGTYTGQVCTTGNTGAYNWTYPAGSLYFLLAGNDGSAEGSYGQDSLGGERSEDLVCAIPQDLTNTCVP